MQKYPIGLQDFEKLREGNFLYVDKTAYIHQLLQGSGYYFLSRPRRFGKSLLLNTLQEIFLGKQHLFKDLWIEHKIEWKKYPILRLDFSLLNYHDNGLEHALSDRLRQEATRNHLSLDKTTPKELLEELIVKLSVYKKVVILIDEYDKPLIDYLDKTNIDIAIKNRQILKTFYSTIKGLDAHIHFFFLTGVSKFSKVSIFSDLNHLNDISVDKTYSAMLGYTQSELEHYFQEGLKKASNDLGLNQETLLEQIRLWYNGYSWGGSERVYNPFSVLNFMSGSDFKNYWFETGSPTFLINLLKENIEYEVDNVFADESMLNSFNLENLQMTTLLFQTGYLTIKERRGNGYWLSYPNLEVKASMSEHILREYTKQKSASYLAQNIMEAFDKRDFDLLTARLNVLFANIPHQIFDEHQEKYYHAVIFTVFKLLGYRTEAEVSTSKGRIDAVVETDSSIFVMEFKIGANARRALKQIKEHDYGSRFGQSGKKIYFLGFACHKKQVKQIIAEEIF